MSDQTIHTLLLHASWTMFITCIIVCVLFCIFPSQMWMIPIMFITLAGFLTTRIIYDRKYRFLDEPTTTEEPEQEVVIEVKESEPVVEKKVKATKKKSKSKK